VGLLVVAGVLGLLIGALQLANLRRLDYRRPDERHLPAPADPWWVVPSTLIAMTLTMARGDPGHPYAALVILPLAVTGAWLSAVDLDVRRLPDRILMPTAVATVLATQFSPVLKVGTLRCTPPSAWVLPEDACGACMPSAEEALGSVTSSWALSWPLRPPSPRSSGRRANGSVSSRLS